MECTVGSWAVTKYLGPKGYQARGSISHELSKQKSRVCHESMPLRVSSRHDLFG